MMCHSSSESNTANDFFEQNCGMIVLLDVIVVVNTQKKKKGLSRKLFKNSLSSICSLALPTGQKNMLSNFEGTFHENIIIEYVQVLRRRLA